MGRLEVALVVVVISGMGVAFAAAFAMNHLPGTTGTSTVTSARGWGTLAASFVVGPTQPVCYATATEGPAPSYYTTIEAVVTDSNGMRTNHSIHWVSNGCYSTGTFGTTLAPGNYSLNLSSCNWLGCRSALPQSFVIQSDTTTNINISISTGIA
jgi:hypothetical protein